MTIRIKSFGFRGYNETWQAMQEYTLNRHLNSFDQIWIVEHEPVFTLGLNGKAEHIIQNINEIPVIHTDRGGQVTYHGPGQLVIYTLLDMQRYKLNARHLVTILENAVCLTLSQFGLHAYARAEAPGVYIAEQKIGSIGLRIKKGCSYHGLSLNNAMNLEPFKAINPCGYQGLKVTQLADFGVNIHTHELAIPLVHAITESLL